jgi:hypothetical protein
MKSQPTYHIVEIKAFSGGSNYRGQFDKVAEDILRAELAILADKLKSKQAVKPVEPKIVAPFTTPPFRLGEFVEQEKDYIFAEIQRKYPGFRKSLIQAQLRKLTALAQDNPDAWNASAYAPPLEVEPELLPSPEPKKGRGKKRKEKKQGRKRPVEVNGTLYESVAMAARTEQGLSRGYIRYHMDKDANSL